MTKDEIRDVIRGILIDLLDDESIEIYDSSTASDVARWDSIIQVRLLLALEIKLDFEFVTTELEDLANVGDLVGVVDRRLRNKSG